MDPEVPLIVPQVNSDDLKKIKKNIIANPNCSTAQLVIALKPLHDLFIIKRIVVSTYQSVSGGGKAPMDELIEQTKLVLDGKKVSSKNFTKQIRDLLNNFEGCKVIDERNDGGYSTPIEAEGMDETFISRIREDKTIKNGLNLWIVSDNLLRGAALNAVEIAETIIKKNYHGK